MRLLLPALLALPLLTNFASAENPLPPRVFEISLPFQGKSVDAAYDRDARLHVLFLHGQQL